MSADHDHHVRHGVRARRRTRLRHGPRHSRILAANDAGCDLLGYTREELLETPISRIHPSELAELTELLERVLRNGRASTIKLTCRTKRGTFLPTEISLHKLEIGGETPHPRARPGPQRTPSTSNDQRGNTPMVTGLIVRLEARADKEDAVAEFLQSAVPLVEGEPQTTAWFAVRLGESSFAIVDFFPDDGGRQAHLAGPVAAALMGRANELLAEPPAIEHVDVLAAAGRGCLRRPRRTRASPTIELRAVSSFGSRSRPSAVNASWAWATGRSRSSTRAPILARIRRRSACAQTAPNSPGLAPITATGLSRSAFAA